MLAVAIGLVVVGIAAATCGRAPAGPPGLAATQTRSPALGSDWLVASPPVPPSQSSAVAPAQPPSAAAPPGSAAPSASVSADQPCADGASGDAVARADDLLRHRYTLGDHPTADLPADPDWDENPFGSDNWQFNLHSLRFVLALFAASDQTGDPRYRERAAELLRDWIEENPRGASASGFAWNDHATAWRATVLACAARQLGNPPWLRAALVTHGEALASEEFYVDAGNHALNQDIGLLDVACLTDHDGWRDLAVERLGHLAASSIDDEGVTNEQAVFYQLYNWRHYVRAAARMAACGVQPPATFDRVERMPGFLAHATLPNGEYVRLGDTVTRPATPIEGTPAAFAATLGERGPAPGGRFASYGAGFAFGRSGWGETRPFTEEIAWSARYGPGRAHHGHADHTAVTMYAFGARLLEDSGTFTYNVDEWHEYARSHRAHNVVTIDELEYDQSRRADLVRATTAPGSDEVVISDGGYPGITNVRRVVFSPALGYLVVEDTLSGRAASTFHQLWHLPAGADPAATASGFRTRLAGANVEVVQLAPTDAVRFVSGQTDPIQGWLAESHQHRTEAPVADFGMRGASARYLTVVVPSADAQADLAIDGLTTTADGFSFRITVDGSSEVVTATAAGVTIVPG